MVIGKHIKTQWSKQINPTKVLEEYPRPQFVRDEWLNLNGEWDFEFDDLNVGQKEKWFFGHKYSKKINVPFAFQTKLSGINDLS